MGSINLVKGLFRLWVVFALCWVVPATVIKFDDLTASLTGYQDPNYPGGIRPVSSTGKLELDLSKLSDDELSRIVNGTMSDEENRRIVNSTTTLPVVTAPIWPQRITTALLIMLPPLVQLLLGYGVLWAIRGFKE